MDPQEFFIGEDGRLFPRKWDRSRWCLYVNVDRSLDTVNVSITGHGGPDGEEILTQHCLDRPCANWRYVLEHAFQDLRDQLEVQLEDALGY